MCDVIQVCVCGSVCLYTFLIILLLECFIQPDPTPIDEDNTGTIALLEHGHFKGRSKHVHLHWCFVCDYIDTVILHLVQTPTRDQLSDLGTKGCPSPPFKFHRSLLRGGL